MTIKNFVESMKAGDTNVSDLISVKKYITAVEKIHVAKVVMDFSVEYDRGFIKISNYKKHMAFIFNVIEAHTDLRFTDDWGSKIDEYDVLCENDLLDVIIGTFEKDYNATREVLDLMCADMLADNSVEASIAKLTQSVSENLDVLVGAVADKLEDFDVEKIIPKDLDLDKLKGFLSKIK